MLSRGRRADHVHTRVLGPLRDFGGHEQDRGATLILNVHLRTDTNFTDFPTIGRWDQTYPSVL